ncbi:hypothetical protein [Streptomyces mirabilis]|uniref:hypothetical protein n=1 Tax=Streptomyces mirabilis TaxID=68239 RepID=UPI003330F93B
MEQGEARTQLVSPGIPERLFLIPSVAAANGELEAFLNVHLGRVYDKVGPSGEISFSLRALLILVSDSAAMLAALVKVEDPDTWKRTAIVREWSRLRGTAMDFNHCDGYNHALWWEPIRHYNAADEADEQIRIRQAWGTEPDGEEGA